ncbi:hypothetical protein BH10PSE17_BH10PSE17_03610 [soil metagenome]
MRERVEDISNGANARSYRNRRAGYPVRITRAVPPLVMMPSDFFSHLHVRDIALSEELGTDCGVRLHDLALGSIQLARLQKNAVWNADLANVMQPRCNINHEADVVVASVLTGEQPSQLTNAVRMLASRVVTKLSRHCETLKHLHLRLH